MSLVVCFAGKIGSGKSSVTMALASELNWKRAGFGDYLRKYVSEGGGDASDIHVLQQTGQQFVEEMPDAFCHAVLLDGGYQVNENFLVDGIRHLDIFDRIRQIAHPSKTRLIFLNATERTRSERVATRISLNEFMDASLHPVESESLVELPRAADLIIDSTLPLLEVLSQCRSAIERWNA